MFAEGVFGKVSLTGQRGHVIQALVLLLEFIDIRYQSILHGSLDRRVHFAFHLIGSIPFLLSWLDHDEARGVHGKSVHTVQSGYSLPYSMARPDCAWG